MKQDCLGSAHSCGEDAEGEGREQARGGGGRGVGVEPSAGANRETVKLSANNPAAKGQSLKVDVSKQQASPFETKKNFQKQNFANLVHEYQQLAPVPRPPGDAAHPFHQQYQTHAPKVNLQLIESEMPSSGSPQILRQVQNPKMHNPNSTGNSPCQVLSANDEELFNYMPRMQIRLPAQNEDQKEAGDLSPPLDTTSHNVMKRKLESDKAQSQDFKHVNVQTSEHKQSSSSVVQSTADKNKLMNFGKNATETSAPPNDADISPETLNRSAQFYDYRPGDTIQIGAQVLSGAAGVPAHLHHISDLNTFAQQLATHKIVLDGNVSGAGGIQGFYGEPIIFSTISQHSHCDHCRHVGNQQGAGGEAGQETQKQMGDQKAQLEKGAKLGVLSKKAQKEKNIKTKCTSPQCCLEACPLEKARPRPHELAFIDFSSSIDHTHELEYTYQKYKHVVNKLKQDFINFSQKQPMRKSVTYFEGGGRKKKQGVLEAVSDENARVAAQLDDLIQQIVDNMSSKKRSICDGVPETCAGRCWHSQKQNHQHSDYESMSNSPRASPDPQAERNSANQYHLSTKLPIHHSLDLSKLRPRASTYDRSKTQRSGAHSRIKTDSEYGSNRRGKGRSSCVAVEKMRKTQGSTLKYKRHRRSLSFKRRNRSKAADGQQKYAQKTGSGEYDLRKPHVLLGIDGKSNSRMQKQQSPKGSGKRLSRLGEGFDYKHSPSATRPKMQLNPNMLRKLQQKSSAQNSKPRNREVSARNQDLETIADFDIQQQHLKQHSLKPSFLNRIHLNDANHRGNGGPQLVQTSRPLNFQLDANQPRNFESTKENQDSQMNESQYQQPFNKSQQGSTVGVTPRNQVMAQNTNSSSLPKQFPNPTMPNNTLQNTPTQQITQATIKQPFFNQSFQQKNVDYSEFNYPQQQIGLTLDPQKLNTSRDCTKTPIPAISPTERSDKNKVSGEQRNYHGMGDKGTQNSNAVNNNTFLKEAHKLSHDSEKNITYNDIEKTGTLSDGNEQNRPFDSLHGAQPSKKDFILQMEAINFHNAGSEAAKNSILNNRESEMRDQQILAPKLQNERVTFTTEIAKQQIKFPLDGEDDITGQTNAGKGFTNTLKKKITMPFNHFVHPSQKNDQVTVVERQLPPGRIKLQIKSNYRSTIDRELQLDQTLHASELSFKEHSQLLYQGSFQQNQQDAQVVCEESLNVGRKPMLQSSIPKISQFDKLPGRNRNHKHVHLIHAAHPPHMSRTNSTSKRELSSTRPIAKVAAAAAAAGEPSVPSESDPARQMQMPSLINASNSRIVVLGETMPDRFKNRGIANRISKAIEGQKEQEKKIVEKSGAREEEEDSQVRIQLNLNSCPANENHQRTQKKDQSWANSNLKTKKVQFRVDMKSRSISKTDVKYRNKSDSRQQSLSNIDPNTLIDPVTMSFEKKLEEGSATRKAAGPDKQVALRELHAKCSNSLNSSELKQQSSVQQQSKFNEPVAMKTKTNFMKKIKIGGNNEALRQMLDYNVRMQALQQEHQRMQNFIFGNLDPEYRESSLKSQTGSYLKNIGSDGLEVIFQSASQNDQFDPQMDRTLKLILQQNNSGTSPELLFSPGTDNRDHDIDHELTKYDDMLASIHTVNQHDQSKKKHHELFSHSVAKLNLQNSMIKRIIKRDQNTCGNMSPPSDTYNPSADHRLKTMNFDRLEKRIKDGSGACIAPYQSNLNETLKQKDLQHQRANTCESEQVVAQPKQTKLQTYQQNHTQNIPTDQEYIWQMQRELQKKKVSNQIGSSLVQTAEREKKDFMNLDIIEQGSRQSRKGSEHPMKTGRNLKSESGLENVKFKSIDIQVQSHRTRVKRNQHTPENQQVMSCLDREETIQELLAIEQQLAQLLKNPNNISTRKYRRVPREQLLNTLRQYVFEQSFRNSKARNLNQSQDQRQKSPFPHDFMEIIGSAAKIKKQRHIQRLHNNRMEFIKNIEYLGQNKKHTENKFWHLGRHQTISEAVRKDRKQRTTSLDFDNFDKLIRQIDIEQKQIKGRQMEAARARGQVLVVKPKRSSNENHTVSLTPTTSNLHHDLQNTFTESKPEIGIATNIANHRLLPSTLHNSQDDPLVQITNRSYLLHQPKNHMKKYANQHLLNYDHIFLNEEQIIKSNMFSENFYRIRESNKIANHLDVIENKLIQKMKEIKLDEQEKRQALVEAGVLDFDVEEAAAIINDKRRESVTAAESKVVHSKANGQRQVHVSQIVKPLKVSVKDALGSQQYSLMQKTPLIGAEKELLTPGSEGQQPKQKDPPIQIHSDKQRSNQTRQITTENYDKEHIQSKTVLKDQDTAEMLSQSIMKSQQFDSKMQFSSTTHKPEIIAQCHQSVSRYDSSFRDFDQDLVGIGPGTPQGSKQQQQQEDPPQIQHEKSLIIEQSINQDPNAKIDSRLVGHDAVKDPPLPDKQQSDEFSSHGPIVIKQSNQVEIKVEESDDKVLAASEGAKDQIQETEPQLTYEDLLSSINLEKEKKHEMRQKALNQSKQSICVGCKQEIGTEQNGLQKQSVSDQYQYIQSQMHERPISILITANQDSDDETKRSSLLPDFKKGKNAEIAGSIITSQDQYVTQSDLTQGKKGSIFNRDRLRFESMLEFGKKHRLTRQSVQKAINDNYILQDIKSRQEMKQRQFQTIMAHPRIRTMQNGAEARNQFDRYGKGKNQTNTQESRRGEYLSVGSEAAQLEKDVMAHKRNTAYARTYLQSAQNSMYDEILPSEFKDSVLETSDQPTFNQSLYERVGIRDSIQSQKMTERPLKKHNKMADPRQSVNLDPITGPGHGAFSPLVRDHQQKKEAMLNWTIRGSRDTQRKIDQNTRSPLVPSIPLNNLSLAKQSQVNNEPVKANQTMHGKQFLSKRQKKQDSSLYIKYIHDKQPLLPALITNQIFESKRRHIIQNGLANSIDISLLRKQQQDEKAGPDYKSATSGNNTGALPSSRRPRGKNNKGYLHQSLDISQINKNQDQNMNVKLKQFMHQLENKIDFSQDFKLDSTRLYNHDLFLQRSQRDSVTQGFQQKAGSKKDTGRNLVHPEKNYR